MKKSALILSLFILFGCELAVDIDVPVPKQKITLNSFFYSDSLWMAELYRDRYILDKGNFEPITDALVIIYQDGVPIDTLISTMPGEYRSDNGKPLQQQSYEIRVSSPVYGSVSAESHIPPPVSIQKANVTIPVPEMDESLSTDTKFNIDVTFNDPPGKNYYEIRVEQETRSIDPATGEENISRWFIPVESDDPLFENEAFNSDESVYFNDKIFEGNEVTIRVGSTLAYIGSMTHFHIYLVSHSEDLYLYKTTSLLQQATSGDPFAQPVNVYNNIHHGVGVFAGYSQSVITYERPKPDPPIIHSFTPTQGSVGDTVTISGENFGSDGSRPSVMLNGRFCWVHSASANEIVFIVPEEATTGLIAVSRYVSGQGSLGISQTVFEVKP